MSVTICHASISENGNAGWDGKAKAGDQTGKEVCTRTWYDKGWTVAIICLIASIAIQAAVIAVKLAASGLVGYDQSQRNTLYQALKKYNFDVDAYIRSGEKTETDCSAFMYAVYACLIPEIRYDGNAPTTSTMRSFYSKYPKYFKVTTESKYLTSDAYLTKGMVLVKEGSHTVMAVSDGSKATTAAAPAQTTTTSTPAPSSGSYVKGIHYVTATSLYARKGPGTSYGTLGTFKNGEYVDVTEISGDWGKVMYKGKEAWCSMKYLKKASTVHYKTTASLYVRTGAGTSNDSLGILAEGKEIAVVSTANGWARHVYKGYQGYSSLKYLKQV